ILNEEGVQIGDGFNHGSIAGDINNETWLLFLRGDEDYTHAGNISGAGAVTKADEATLHLTGTNTFTGGLYINDGTLVGANHSLGKGNISIKNSATLQVPQTEDATFEGQLSGDGNLIKAEAGTWTLTGDSAGFAGSTTVSGGK